MRNSISTQDITLERRFQYWQQFICDFCLKIDTKQLTGDRFWVEVDAFALEQFELATIRSAPIEVSQHKGHISQATDRFFKITIQTEGEGILRQNGRELILRPGDWTFYDSTEPYELIFPHSYQQLILKVPAATLANKIPLIDAFCAQRFDRDDGIGVLAKQMMVNINQYFEVLKLEHHNRLAQILLELVAESINSSFLDLPLDVSNRTIWYLRIRAFIDQHFRDNTLNLDMIATHFAFSKRYIHAVFQSQGVSATKYITQKRLAFAQALLVDPLHQHRSITEIALMAGFNSDAHFRKLFKQKTAVTPKHYRKLGGNRHQAGSASGASG